jgi:flagellar protein FlaG
VNAAKKAYRLSKGKDDLMVSDVTSKLTVTPSRLGTGVTPVASPEATGKTLEKSGTHLSPIPKAEIKIDLERESQDLKDAIGKLNDMLQAGARNVSFSLDQKLGRPVVYVKNATTGEVVRQIPNEVVVRIAHSIEDFKGMLHNEKT